MLVLALVLLCKTRLYRDDFSLLLLEYQACENPRPQVLRFTFHARRVPFLSRSKGAHSEAVSNHRMKPMCRS